MDTLTPTKAVTPLLPSAGTEVRANDTSLRVSSEEPQHQVPSKRVSSETARIIGIRDSSGDRMEVRVDPKDGMVVRIVNESGDVIRQIPPEELVALARRLDDAIGFLFDKKA
jgi:uncharacterized FlaG/YvyC family protein